MEVVVVVVERRVRGATGGLQRGGGKDPSIHPFMHDESISSFSFSLCRCCSTPPRRSRRALPPRRRRDTPRHAATRRDTVTRRGNGGNGGNDDGDDDGDGDGDDGDGGDDDDGAGATGEFALLRFSVDDVAVAFVTLAVNLHTLHAHVHAPYLRPAPFADLSAIFGAVFPNALVALHWACVLPTYSLQFHSIIPVHSIPLHSILFRCIPFHSIALRYVLTFHFRSIPFHSAPFHSVPFYDAHSIPFIPFHSIPFHSIPFHSIPFHSSHSIHPIPFHSIPFHSVMRPACALPTCGRTNERTPPDAAPDDASLPPSLLLARLSFR